MVYYCSTSDVGQRLGLNSAQRVQAGNTLQIAIRRASIEIEQVFNDYGRINPVVLETTSNGAVAVGATTITLVSSTGFTNTGSGNIDGDTIAWTGITGLQLTGVTGVSIAHISGVKVQSGEFAHVLREICGDIAAAYYMEDESTFHDSGDSLRGNVLRERGVNNLTRLAHLGSFS
tara:strand:+ start:3719 stop:4243 length:525 start_codon:yes stop_codon:yes gene_type:complete